MSRRAIGLVLLIAVLLVGWRAVASNQAARSSASGQNGSDVTASFPSGYRFTTPPTGPGRRWTCT